MWATSRVSQTVQLHSASVISSALIRTMWESSVHVRHGWMGGKDEMVVDGGGRGVREKGREGGGERKGREEGKK